MAFIGNLWRLCLVIHFFQLDRAVLTHWRDAIFWRVIFLLYIVARRRKSHTVSHSNSDFERIRTFSASPEILLTLFINGLYHALSGIVIYQLV